MPHACDVLVFLRAWAMAWAGTLDAGVCLPLCLACLARRVTVCRMIVPISILGWVGCESGSLCMGGHGSVSRGNWHVISRTFQTKQNYYVV